MKRCSALSIISGDTSGTLSLDDLREQLGPLYSQIKKFENVYLKKIKQLEDEVSRLKRTELILPFPPIFDELERIPPNIDIIDLTRRTDFYSQGYLQASLKGWLGLDLYVFLYGVKKYREELVITSEMTNEEIEEACYDFFASVIERKSLVLKEFERKATSKNLTVTQWINEDPSMEEYRFKA